MALDPASGGLLSRKARFSGEKVTGDEQVKAECVKNLEFFHLEFKNKAAKHKKLFRITDTTIQVRGLKIG